MGLEIVNQLKHGESVDKLPWISILDNQTDGVAEVDIYISILYAREREREIKKNNVSSIDRLRTAKENACVHTRAQSGFSRRLKSKAVFS